MPNYKPYPKKVDTKSRKARKGDRAKVFQHNKSLGPKLRREKRLARKQAALEAEEATEE